MFVTAIRSLAERDLFSSSSPTLPSREQTPCRPGSTPPPSSTLYLHECIATNHHPPATPRIDRHLIAQNAAFGHRIFRQRCQAVWKENGAAMTFPQWKKSTSILERCRDTWRKGKMLWIHLRFQVLANGRTRAHLYAIDGVELRGHGTPYLHLKKRQLRHKKTLEGDLRRSYTIHKAEDACEDKLFAASLPCTTRRSLLATYLASSLATLWPQNKLDIRTVLMFWVSGPPHLVSGTRNLDGPSVFSFPGPFRDLHWRLPLSRPLTCS
jgi:hypothetical protein